MAQAGSKAYQDERTGDEVYDDLTERGPAKEGRWRPPYGLIAVVCALFLVVGFGSGFGAGWAAKPDEDSDCDMTLKPTNNATVNSTEDDTIRAYVPMSYTGDMTNDALQLHYEQMAVIHPAMDVISLLVSTLAGKGVLYTNQALRVFIFKEFEAKQDTIAKLYNVAQRLQRSDFDKRLYNISTGFVDVIAYIRDNQDKIGNSGRRLLGSAQPLAVQLLKAFVKNGLNAPELKDARERLEAIWTTDELVDLAVDLASVVSDFASRFNDIAAYQEKSHPDQGAPPQQEEAEVVDVDVKGNGTLALKVSVPLGGRLIVGAVDDPLVQDSASVGGTGGRRQLQDLQVKIPLPAGFVAAPPASSPNVLIPTVWHVFMYRNADGTLGPPGVETACDMIVRLLTISNFRLLPSKFQLFMKECRNDPVAHPYLRMQSRDVLQACTTYGFFYENCGDPLIKNSIGDFPRSINIYVAGEEPDTPYVGYGWVPGSQVDPYTGHIGLTYTSISTSGVNSRTAKEAGATSLVHEVLHHLGMPHTFQDKNLPCVDVDLPAGVNDTPMSQGPVWNQSWSSKAGLACKNMWSNILVADYDLANQQASIRVGIPTAESTAGFDSCNADNLNDELANYITYTYDVCLLASGHLTSGQIAAMHRITANSNPTSYAWGQYYAQNPPAGIQPSYVVAPASSPPPSPPPPASTPCVSKADGGCMCKPRWQAISGAWFEDCTTTPDTPKRGSWCAVELSGNCVAPKNGWWDTCTKTTACTKTTVVPSSPPPSPPPPSPPPPASTPFCGAGATTRNGRTCIKTQWKLSSSATTYTGCANPTNDPKGPFCALVPGTTSPSGASWDYCLEGCPNVGTPTWPKLLCTNPNPKVFINSFCTCKTDYAITFEDTGKTYAGLSGCVGFEESGGSGLCIGSCSSGKGNNKPITCGC